MQSKKSIVLSSTKENQQKAVLTLQEEKEGIRGSVRLYNFARDVEGICSLGIYHDGKVDKAGMTAKGKMFYEFFLSIKKIPERFSVAVVNFVDAEPSPILFGSSEGSDDETYASIISQIKGKGYQQTKDVLDSFGVDFEDEEKEQIEKEIDAALGCDNKCEQCVYKKAFFEQNAKNEVFEQKNSEISAKKSDFLKNEDVLQDDFVEDLPKNSKEENKNLEEKDELFFDRLKPQIDKLFENNPVDERLQNLIPSSNFVRVEYEDAGDFFVFGLLYDENGEVKYVCYGVPAVFDEEPPEELSGYPVWLPLGEKDGFGYWLTYQDASTGEPVKAIIS